jgi:hypothetical protein
MNMQPSALYPAVLFLRKYRPDMGVKIDFKDEFQNKIVTFFWFVCRVFQNMQIMLKYCACHIVVNNSHLKRLHKGIQI